MRLADLVSLVLGGLRRRKLRFLLTVVGVVIGTAAVVLMMALGAGMQRSMMQQITTGTATQIRVMPAGSMGPMSEDGAEEEKDLEEPRKLDDEAADELAELPNVTSVRPRLMVQSDMISFKKYESYGTVWGVPLESLKDWDVEMEAGRMPAASSECVVGAQVPYALLSGRDGGPMATGFGPRVDLLDKRLAVSYAPMTTVTGDTDGEGEDVSTQEAAAAEEAAATEPAERSRQGRVRSVSRS